MYDAPPSIDGIDSDERTGLAARVGRAADSAGLRRFRRRFLPDSRVDQSGRPRGLSGDEDREAAISRFSGPVAPLADVLDEVCTLPFFSRRRLVIVEEADPFVSKHRKDLEAYVANPSESGILLLQVKQWPATTKLAKLVEKPAWRSTVPARARASSPRG